MIKYIIGLVVCYICAVMVGSSVYAADPFPYDTPAPIPVGKFGTELATDPRAAIKDSVTDPDGPIQKLLALFLPSRSKGEGVLWYLQYIINIALSIVAFIAIIVLIYGFYGILFGDSQEGIKRAQKIIKGTFIAIIVMGASWLIVRAMFYIITQLQ